MALLTRWAVAPFLAESAVSCKSARPLLTAISRKSSQPLLQPIAGFSGRAPLLPAVYRSARNSLQFSVYIQLSDAYGSPRKQKRLVPFPGQYLKLGPDPYFMLGERKRGIDHDGHQMEEHHTDPI